MCTCLQAKTGRVDEIGKNDPLAGLPNPGAAADKALGGLKDLGGNPLEGLGDKVATPSISSLLLVLKPLLLALFGYPHASYEVPLLQGGISR